MMSKMKEILRKFKPKKPEFQGANSFKINKKYLVLFLVAALFAMLCVLALRAVPKETTLAQFNSFLANGAIKDAQIDEQKLIFSANGSKYFVIKDSVNLALLNERVPISVKSDFAYDFALLALVLFLVFFVIGVAKKRKANAQVSAELNSMVEAQGITPTISNVAFKDVAGIDEVKSELLEIVDFLKHPRVYRDFGVNLPKGVLMIGPPGVGKTLVAKAVAGEANVPFFYQSGASFVQIYVGMGAKRVRELFAKAKSYAPSIIFIDEIDAVGKARGGGRNDEREATLNQLLTEMDGFNDNSGVIVIAATNKVEMIDEALLRSGRFDRRIYLALPDLNDRSDILKTYLAKKNHEVDIDLIAKHTTGFSGAGLSTLVNEAAINALKNKRKKIIDEDFKAVFDKVLHGKRKIYSLNQKEKQTQALYKAAKALSAEWFGVEFERISLLEDRFVNVDKAITSKSEIIAKIKVLLAGRAAMQIYQNELYSNCESDIKEAKELAKMLSIDYAMSENILADLSDVDNVLKSSYSEVYEFVRSLGDKVKKLQEHLEIHESVTKAFVSDFIKAQYE